MYDVLFEPIQIGSLRIRNRFFISPHTTNYIDANGIPDARAVHYYAERAKGGVGLMAMGASTVTGGSARVKGATNAFDPRAIDAWRRIADAVHTYDGRILAMLSHFGRLGRTGDGRPLVAPSPIIDWNFHHSVPHELGLEEIRSLVQAFADAAARVREGGMDGIELQGAHGFLIAQFLSPATNRRADAYGGDFERRLRFCLEVVDAVRRAVGTDFVVGMRISGDELVPGGLTLTDSCAIVQRLEQTRQIDFIDVSGGTDGDLMSLALHIPSMYVPPGNLVPLAAAVKQVTKLPVFCVGGIRDPAMAAKIVASGHADMVGMVRAHIADPHLVTKIREGRLEDIRRCIGCMQACTEALSNELPISCVYNPVTGREEEWGTIAPATRRRRVVVVGGGPGGLETARVAALRGHTVTLFESEDELGGQLRLAARLPRRDNFLEVIRFLSHQISKLHITVRVGCRAEPASVLAETPDCVVIATGARPAVPEDFPESERLIHVADVVAGRRATGDSVLIVDVDGHLRGCGTADMLAGEGKHVRIASEQIYVGANIDLKTLYPLYRRLYEQRVEMLPLTRLVGWDNGKPVIADIFTGNQSTLADVDSVVWSSPGAAETSLAVQLREAGLEVHLVGDCIAPRRLESAIIEAQSVARSL
jgi:mycofactocin system FadH/OYE family oxidoreductase 2